MTEITFLPEIPLRHLGFNMILGKTSPPQTLYWHCLNTYYCADTLSNILPTNLNDNEKRILKWASLLHDAGKGTDAWEIRGHGPHTPDEIMRNRINELLENPELTMGYEPTSQEEKDIIIELITEHHTRKTLSKINTERIMKIVKLADKITSRTRIDYTLANEIYAFIQPSYKPLVLTAEDHPISYYALSIADTQAEINGAMILLTNKLQSLYLVKESIDINIFKQKIVNMVANNLSLSHEGRDTLSRIYSWISALPIQDYDTFINRLHSNKEQIREEMEKSLESKEKQLAKNIKKGLPSDEGELWFGPFRLLLDVSKKQNSTTLIGTNITLDSFKKPGSPMPDKEIASNVAASLESSDPHHFIEIVLDLILKNTVSTIKPSSLVLDIFHWNDEVLDVTNLAKEAYGHYRATQWNSKSQKRKIDKYCFSCKRRPPTRPAPTGNVPTNTWTSSVAEKSKIYVCDLCYTTQAYILPRIAKGKFHIDATPAYNQARIDWNDIFWQGLVSDQFMGSWVSSHHVLLDLRANTPNNAIVNALGYSIEFQHGTSKEYRSFADMLYLHGLHGTISSGPQHPGKFMLTGCGLRINFAEWGKYGNIMKMLRDTHPYKVFPAHQIWQKLTQTGWAWGTLLTIRHRRESIKGYHVKDIQELINMKSAEKNGTILDKVRSIPLHIADRDERFKTAEAVFRRMDRVTRTAAKHTIEYGSKDDEVIQRIAEIGKKHLRSRIIKNSKSGSWVVSDERLLEVEVALTEMAKELWNLRNNHMARNDFINAAIMAIAYNPKKEE